MTRGALAHQDEKVLLNRLGVVHAGRLPRRNHPQGETGLRFHVLVEIRTSAQDEIVGFEDADAPGVVVVHPGGVARVDYEPPRTHRGEAGLHGFESCLFNHLQLLPE
jgi:hypothetical protein